MKKHLILSIATALMLTGCSTAQKVQTNRVPHPVELTPFSVGLHEQGLLTFEIKDYAKKIGYNKNVNVRLEEWPWHGWQIEYWSADFFDGTSFVEIMTWLDEKGLPSGVQWVCYTWHKKKDMPKGLYEGHEYRDYQNQKCSYTTPNATSVNWIKYKNHYSIGTTAYNPYKPLRGNVLTPWGGLVPATISNIQRYRVK